MRTHTNMRVSVCVFLSLFVFVSVFGCIRMCIYVYFLVRVHVRVRVCVCTTVKFPQEMPGCRNRPHSEGMEAKQSREVVQVVAMSCMVHSGCGRNVS
mmetsp:Transcript_29008/g.46697  ORF Transcript_29008/g.46697 Transcript_29008/m.46697 type:complete len:97 (-) Transcript_29008:745-1035(-)